MKSLAVVHMFLGLAIAAACAYIIGKDTLLFRESLYLNVLTMPE